MAFLLKSFGTPSLACLGLVVRAEASDLRKRSAKWLERLRQSVTVLICLGGLGRGGRGTGMKEKAKGRRRKKTRK